MMRRAAVDCFELFKRDVRSPAVNGKVTRRHELRFSLCFALANLIARDRY